MEPELVKADNEHPYIQLGKHQLSFDIQDLDGIYLERARLELRETEEVKDEAIQELKRLLRGKDFSFFLN